MRHARPRAVKKAGDEARRQNAELCGQDFVPRAVEKCRLAQQLGECHTSEANSETPVRRETRIFETLIRGSDSGAGSETPRVILNMNRQVTQTQAVIITF
jgi:hypothetical protein